MSQSTGAFNGQVTLNDTPIKHKLYRFCEKKIDQWLKAQMSEDSSEVEFNVSFTEEPDTRQISCVTEIQLKGSIWRGCDLAGDTQQAFMHSLKRMQPH